MDQHRRGDLAAADRLYLRFLQLQPAHSQALRLRGILARERGNLDLSIDLLTQASAAAPLDAEPPGELALSQLAAGNLDKAEQALRIALDRDGDALRARANLGALLQYRGHLAEAVDCLRRVLAATPDDLETRCNLAYTLSDAGHGEEALAELDVALASNAEHPYLLAARGAVLAGLDRFSQAEECLVRATTRNAADDMALVNLALVRRETGRPEPALISLRSALRANPDNARAAADLVNLLAETGDVAAAIMLAEEFLGRHPGDRLVIAAWSLALRDAGRTDEAARLIDFDNLLRVSEPPVPAGWHSRQDFLGELSAAILGDTSLLASPASKATRGGSQTGELSLAATPALAGLQELFERETAAMVATLVETGYADHPVMAYAARHYSLRAWGTVLTAGGRQLPHQHPLGFLSGVYYVELPAGREAGDAEAGGLEFGLPPARMHYGQQPELRRVEPVPGRLVIFPSWFYHRTLPFQVPGHRISIAFDLVPRA